MASRKVSQKADGTSKVYGTASPLSPRERLLGLGTRSNQTHFEILRPAILTTRGTRAACGPH